MIYDAPIFMNDGYKLIHHVANVFEMGWTMVADVDGLFSKAPTKLCYIGYRGGV